MIEVGGGEYADRRGYRGLWLAVALGVALVPFWPSINSLFWLWWEGRNGAYSHGLLLFPICMMLLLRTAATQGWVVRRSTVGTVLLLLSSLLWAVAFSGRVSVVEQAALPVVLAAFCWALLGYRQARPLFFPIFLVVLGIPLWDPVAPVLQQWTVPAVMWVLAAIGAPAVREGVMILIPSGTFEVESSCSGMNQMLVAAALSLIYSRLNNLRMRHSLLIFIAALGVGFVSNVFRIVLVIVIGNFAGMDSKIVTDHGWLGWWVFGSVIALFYWGVGHVKSMGEVPHESEPAGPLEPRPHQRLLAALIPLALVTGPSMAYLSRPQPKDVEIHLPEMVARWSLDRTRTDDWQPRWIGYQSGGNGIYTVARQAAAVHVWIFHYESQTHGHEAVNDVNELGDGLWWHAVPHGTARRAGISVQESELKARDGRRRLVWLWYQVGTIRTGDPLLAKSVNAVLSAVGEPRITVYLVATDGMPSEQARERLSAFVLDGYLQLEEAVEIHLDRGA